jgi:RimJ/RimL family protein N-acetyltransferase
MTFYFWEGASVRLRAPEPTDWEHFLHWSDDADLMGALDDLQFPQSKEYAKSWAQKMATERPTKDEFFLVIETLTEHGIVGSINSHHCDRRNGTFMYGISVEEGARRRGYASDAIIMLLRFFFMEMGYQKCTVEVADFNEASQKLHESLGFQQEGRLRSFRLLGGKRRDVFMYGMTRDEFDERHVLE